MRLIPLVSTLESLQLAKHSLGFVGRAKAALNKMTRVVMMVNLILWRVLERRNTSVTAGWGMTCKPLKLLIFIRIHHKAHMQIHPSTKKVVLHHQEHQGVGETKRLHKTVRTQEASVDEVQPPYPAPNSDRVPAHNRRCCLSTDVSE